MQTTLPLRVIYVLRVVAIAATLAIGAPRTDGQTTAYVTNSSGGTLTKIDTATDATLGTITVGTTPSRIAITRDGAVGYATNSVSNSVSVIDLATDTVTATIAVGNAPSAIAVTPDGKQLYVMVADGVVHVVDTTDRCVIGSITVGGADGGIAFTPDGTRAYVGGAGISVINTATRAVIKNLPIGWSSGGVAISPDGKRAYVATMFFDTVSDFFSVSGGLVVIDTATDTEITTIGLGMVPWAVALSPDGTRAYVGIASRWVNTGYGAGALPGRWVAVIDTATNAGLGFIDVGKRPADLAVTPDGTQVYVTVPEAGSVAVIDTASNSVRTTLAVSSPNGVAIAPLPSDRERIAVSINVRPGGAKNRVNARKPWELLPVAILSTPTFDAGSVSPATVRFGATGTEAAAVDFTRKDVDGDGDVDLLLRFRTGHTGLECGATSSALTGQTSAGEAIYGSDRVLTINCK